MVEKLVWREEMKEVSEEKMKEVSEEKMKEANQPTTNACPSFVHGLF